MSLDTILSSTVHKNMLDRCQSITGDVFTSITELVGDYRDRCVDSEGWRLGLCAWRLHVVFVLTSVFSLLVACGMRESVCVCDLSLTGIPPRLCCVCAVCS